MIGARSEAGGRPGREDMAAKDIGGAISALCLVPLPIGESTQHGRGVPMPVDSFPSQGPTASQLPKHEPIHPRSGCSLEVCVCLVGRVNASKIKPRASQPLGEPRLLAVYPTVYQS